MVIEESATEAPKYKIGVVTRLTGLSADVVRVWERRYGVVSPARSEGGSRLYSDADISRLRQLRQAVERGHNIGQVAKLSPADLEHLIGGPRRSEVEVDPYEVTRSRFMEAVARMDVVGADRELSRAATLYPPGPLIKHIITPILMEIGDRWAHRDIGVAHEHVATGLLRNVLSSLFRLYSPGESAETIVLATPAGERHEFGLLLAALLAATHGWRVVYLGADLPAGEIAYALRLTKARHLALSLAAPPEAALNNELESIASQVPAATRVWVGGTEAINHREFLNRVNWVLVRDLDDLDDRLRR